MNKSYEEIITIPSFEERYEYLKLGGRVGEETFGFDRYLNQRFYNSYEWKHFRRDIIVRDCGCDMAFDDGFHEISGKIIIHHINPIAQRDIYHHDTNVLLNPNNVVCVSYKTHEAIHYGDSSLLDSYHLVVRRPNDTTPWK